MLSVRTTLALLLTTVTAFAATPGTFPVTIRVDAAKEYGELKPINRFFGADEPNYATMRDGRRLLADIGRLGDGQAYFRAHNLLNTGDGTPAPKWGSTNVYTEDAQGHPVYDWTDVDRIFDTYLARGVHPYAEIGFMPEALSTHPHPYQHDWRPGFPYDRIFTGWSYPPKDYATWGELVYRWVRHCVARYGAAEVSRWYWEVWNEPNIGYWHGTLQQFEKLHDYAIAAVLRALPTARVGGPDCAGDGGKFMDAFLAHCLHGRNYATGGVGSPLDFVSFHAKGSPSFVDGHVRMGVAAQLRTIDTAFARFARYPELKHTPIIIGESDPDGCAACQDPQFGYRNTSQYGSYLAESFARTQLLAERRGVNLVGAITWAFEFEDQPYFAGYRVMATNGIPLPVFNVQRMMAKLGGRRIAAVSSADRGTENIVRSGVRGAPDVAALASIDPARRQLTVLIWHYHDDAVPGPAAAVDLDFAGLPAGLHEVRLTHDRVDHDHSNAYTAWREMGSPRAPSLAQYARLKAASELATLATAPATLPVKDGRTRLIFTLPRQAVSLVILHW